MARFLMFRMCGVLAKDSPDKGPSGSDHNAAIDGNHGTVDEACLVRSEPKVCVGHVFRCSCPSQRRSRHHGLEDLRRHRPHHVCRNKSRSHGIDANLVPAQLPCPGPRHSDDTGLGSHVIRLPEVSRSSTTEGADRITPPPPLIMWGTTARVTRKTPFKLTPITESHTSSLMIDSGLPPFHFTNCAS